MIKEIEIGAAGRLRQIKYEKIFFGVPDSIFEYSFRNIEYCYVFAFFDACTSLIGTCLEKALKSELIRTYSRIAEEDLKDLELGEVINKAEDLVLISGEELTKARRVNRIRKKYVHVDIKNIKEIFEYKTYYQISDRIQSMKFQKEGEKDCLKAYKDLMAILEYLYSKKRYPLKDKNK